MPRHLRAPGHVADPQPHPVEDIAKFQAAFAYHLGERLGVAAIGAGFLRSDRAGSGVERHQHPGLRLDQRQAAGERRAGSGKGIESCEIEDHHARAEPQARERPQVIGHTQRLDRNIEVARNPRIDGDDVIFTFELQSVTADIDKSDGIGTRGRRLVEEVTQRPAQRVLVEIAGPDHVETRRLQGLGDEPGVVCSRRERAGLVIGIADDQCDPSLGRLSRGRNDRQHRSEQENA